MAGQRRVGVLHILMAGLVGLLPVSGFAHVEDVSDLEICAHPLVELFQFASKGSDTSTIIDYTTSWDTVTYELEGNDFVTTSCPKFFHLNSIVQSTPTGWQFTNQNKNNCVHLIAKADIPVPEPFIANFGFLRFPIGDKSVICIFNVKQLANIFIVNFASGAGSTEFGFTVDGQSFSLQTEQFAQVLDLDPDDSPFSIVETLPTGWGLQSANCDNGDDPGAITLNPGDNVTCSYAHQQLGQIVTQKTVTPGSDTSTAFTFTPDYGIPFMLADGESNTSSGLAPGTYSVIEAVPANWQLDSFSCDDSTSDFNNINVADGVITTCTFTNSQFGTIAVEKQVTTGSDTTVDFDFTADYDAGGFQLSDGESNTSAMIPPGSHSVTEDVPDDWVLDSVSCNNLAASTDPGNIVVAPGEAVTCIFENRQFPRITIVKTVTDGSDPTVPFTFTPSYGATFALKDGEKHGSPGDLAAGSYSVVETVPSNWEFVSFLCDNPAGSTDPTNIVVSADPSEQFTCTFTNNEFRNAQLIIQKEVTTGSDTDFEFSYLVSYDILADIQLADGDSQTSPLLAAMSYSVQEGPVPNWRLLSFSCDNIAASTDPTDIVLAPNEIVTCTFTNDELGLIEVVKETTSGSELGFLFTFTLSGTEVFLGPGDINPFLLGTGDEGKAFFVTSGTYSIVETPQEGWLLDSISCDNGSTDATDFSVSPGEFVTCTFTNSQVAHLTIEKAVTAGSNTGTQFTFTPGYDSTNPFKLRDGDTHSATVAAEAQSVTETLPTGWVLDAFSCDNIAASTDPGNIVLTVGEVVTCTFTNRQIATLTVYKLVTTGSDFTTPFTFTPSFDEPFSLAHFESRTFNLEPGGSPYSVDETLPPGWEFLFSSCDNADDPDAITLAQGDDVTCFFHNSELGTIVIKQATNPPGAEGDFTFSQDIDGSGDFVLTLPGTSTMTFPDVPSGIYRVAQEAEQLVDVFVSLEDAPHLECDDADSHLHGAAATIQLAPAEVVTCIFDNRVGIKIPTLSSWGRVILASLLGLLALLVIRRYDWARQSKH